MLRLYDLPPWTREILMQDSLLKKEDWEMCKNHGKIFERESERDCLEEESGTYKKSYP